MAKVMTVERELEMRGMLEELRQLFPYTESGFLDMSNYVAKRLLKGSPDLTRSQLDVCRYLFNNGTKITQEWRKVKLKIKKKWKGTIKEVKARKKNKGKKELVTVTVETKNGKRLRMIQASRGMGKTTLSAIYGVFRLIHDTKTRILIFSAGGGLAAEISKWVIQIIEGIPLFSFLAPDEQNGDRSSIKSYDIHWLFRGSEKSPSIKCLGVNSNAAGSRADIILADDVESLKNARTVTMRDMLIDQSKEFESICSTGDIIYLGTPQFTGSIYNDLPSRGYDVRIWPGRYPTDEQLSNYGESLAPMFVEDMLKNPLLKKGGGIDMQQGQPTNPAMLPEILLQEKEVAQGKSKYQLQFMLNTRLTDSERFPLKINNVIFADFSANKAPAGLVWCNDQRASVHEVIFPNAPTDKMYGPLAGDYDLRPFDKKVMYIDGAGGGKAGDETGYAVVGVIGADVYVIEWGGVAGGYEHEKLMKLVNIAKDCDVKEVHIEKNFGNGAHRAAIEPLFQVHFPVTLEDDWVSYQKELRIIDTLEPIMDSHRLIIRKELISKDRDSCERYASNDKKTYSGLFQMSMISRDRDCLRHDDRLDALAGAVDKVLANIVFDNMAELRKRRESEVKAWIAKYNKPNAFRDELTYEEVVNMNRTGNILRRHAA